VAAFVAQIGFDRLRLAVDFAPNPIDTVAHTQHTMRAFLFLPLNDHYCLSFIN
jgi:hypothetical protein